MNATNVTRQRVNNNSFFLSHRIVLASFRGAFALTTLPAAKHATSHRCCHVACKEESSFSVNLTCLCTQKSHHCFISFTTLKIITLSKSTATLVEQDNTENSDPIKQK
jgi:hypothetical protein